MRVTYTEYKEKTKTETQVRIFGKTPVPFYIFWL